VTLSSIKSLLKENEYVCNDEALSAIMGKLVHQQSTDGEVVDLSRFLTAVRPRVW